MRGRDFGIGRLKRRLLFNPLMANAYRDPLGLNLAV